MVADVYNTTVNLNGKTVFSSSISTNAFNYSGYGMGSCFGFGFGGGMPMCGFGGGFMPMFGFGGGFMPGLGFGLGMAAGMSLIPAMPFIIKGCGWLGTNVIVPAATNAWKGICTAASWVGKTVSKAAKSVGKAIGGLFHKKPKTKDKDVKAEKPEDPKSTGQIDESSK